MPEDKNFETARVGGATEILKEIEDKAQQFLAIYNQLNDHEQALVGVLVVVITNPWEIQEFDGFIGNPFIIDASIKRLLTKMALHQQRQMAQAQAQASNLPPIFRPEPKKILN